jgi:hypothetical protein
MPRPPKGLDSYTVKQINAILEPAGLRAELKIVKVKKARAQKNGRRTRG